MMMSTCPKCVFQVRHEDHLREIECPECGHKFTTILDDIPDEEPEVPTAQGKSELAASEDGGVESFDEDAPGEDEPPPDISIDMFAENNAMAPAPPSAEELAARAATETPPPSVQEEPEIEVSDTMADPQPEAGAPSPPDSDGPTEDTNAFTEEVPDLSPPDFGDDSEESGEIDPFGDLGLSTEEPAPEPVEEQDSSLTPNPFGEFHSEPPTPGEEGELPDFGIDFSDPSDPSPTEPDFSSGVPTPEPPNAVPAPPTPQTEAPAAQTELDAPIPDESMADSAMPEAPPTHSPIPDVPGASSDAFSAPAEEPPEEFALEPQMGDFDSAPDGREPPLESTAPFSESANAFDEIREFGENLGTTPEAPPEKPTQTPRGQEAQPAPDVPSLPLTSGDTLVGYTLDEYLSPVSATAPLETGENPLRAAFNQLLSTARKQGANGVVAVRWTAVDGGKKVVVSGTAVKCTKA